jgi:Putative auto-transporter adhesin, head GIN domain
MKTTILTLATIATLALGLGNTTYAAGKKDSAKATEVSTVLTNVSAINKIEIRGNVEVFISDGDADQVKVYNKYYEQTALVQSQNGVLRITSYADQKLVVWVKAADLRAITAYDNAEVKSFGTLSPIALNVSLHNNASANLNLDAYSANVTVADRATADLSGRADQFTLNHGVATSVNKFNFVADRSTINKVTAAKGVEMAGL